jgi:predicted GIY-YIG superfamily endonuclease
MVYIYILKLQQGKYYVGKTTNPDFRLEKHFSSSGSAWTKKYKPISVLEIIPNCDDYDEDKHTIKYMEKYGINNVRGGSFCEIKLSDNNRITLNQIIKSVTDKCYICGKKDHFANDCKNFSIKKEKTPTINVNEKCDCPTSYFSSHRRGKCVLNNIISYFDDEDDDIDKLLIQEDNNDGNDGNDKNQIKTINCFRCGRAGHYSASCYASKHIKGYFLNN